MKFMWHMNLNAIPVLPESTCVVLATFKVAKGWEGGTNRRVPAFCYACTLSVHKKEICITNSAPAKLT